MVVEIDHAQIDVDRRRPFGFRNLAHTQREAQVLFDRKPWQKRRARVLEEHHAIAAGGCHRRLVGHDRARGHRLETSENIEQSGLAAA
jgi:hypothetical protein